MATRVFVSASGKTVMTRVRATQKNGWAFRDEELKELLLKTANWFNEIEVLPVDIDKLLIEKGLKNE